jgi:hypothetical protein
MTSVFAKYQAQAYPYQFTGRIYASRIAGGTPTDPKVAEAWLKTKFAENDDLIREAVAQIMAERGVSAEEAVVIANELKHLNGFCRDDNGLYIKGMQLKACIKEAANIRWPKAKWGPSSKGTMGFFAEHVFVKEDRMHLGRGQADRIEQRFVHTWRGNGIQYEEVIEDAEFDFHIETDYDFKASEWGMLWSTAENQGIGATRSQGFGKFEVVAWDKA